MSAVSHGSAVNRALRGWLFAGAAVASVGAGIGAYALTQTRERSLPPLPTSNVPSKFQQLRQGFGHDLHVTQEGIECRECHDIEHGFAPRGQEACAHCHEPQARMQHALHPQGALTKQLADCLACHAFDAEPKDRRWDCMRCHEQSQGALPAVVHHAQEDCGHCHRPHEDTALVAADCTACHLTSENTHGTRALPAHGGMPVAGHGAADAGLSLDRNANCLQCHRAHDDSARAGDRCLDCHDKPHALFSGHDTCTGCHAPHAFAASDAADCRSCHQSQHVLAEQRAPAHRACTNCHAPHEVAAVGDATCQGCHDTVSPAHPSVAGHRCTSCHQPHAGAASAPSAQPCTSCHSVAEHDQDAHGGHAACTACHTPHAFADPAQPGVCVDCHRAQLAQVSSNQDHANQNCLGCHGGDVHDAKLPPAPCTDCHTSVHPRPEHTQCTACHQPHSGAPRAQAQSCGQCHAQEQHSTATVHRDCLACHTAHDGGKLPAAQCTGCHAAKAAQNHGHLAEGCTTCHPVHSDEGLRATPTCTSCHATQSLPGLHAQPAHRDCAICHKSAHDPGPFSARATCIACHAEQRDHIPDARLCQGCHVFRQ